jgi:hypothetical protein
MADDDTLDPAARFLDLDAGIAQIVRAVEQARARWPVVDVRQYALIDTLRWLAECLEEGMSPKPVGPDDLGRVRAGSGGAPVPATTTVLTKRTDCGLVRLDSRGSQRAAKERESDRPDHVRDRCDNPDSGLIGASRP